MRTHEVVADTVSAHLVKLLSRAFGLDPKTIEAWRRPKASDTEPTGTGKANPLDQVERAMRIIHHYNPAGARRWAQYTVDVCDELDKERAACGFESSGDRCDKIARLISENAEAVVALMRNEDDVEALRELEEMLAAGKELADCLRAEMAQKVH